MSIFKKAPVITAQGPVLVKRDENNRVVGRATMPAMMRPNLTHWRKLARDCTDNGMDMLRVLINIANGHPQKTKLPDGTESDWVVPSIETQRTAAKDVFEFMHGKAVAATEMMKVEQDAEDLAQYTALSDADIEAAAAPFLERIRKERGLLNVSSDTKDDEQ
jgi:hypothetical protein